MTLLLEPSSPSEREPATDTQPFEFVGADSWGHAVRGRVEALNAETAELLLRSRGIAPTTLEPGRAERQPYRVEIAIVPQSPQSVGDLVRRVMARRVLHEHG